MSEAAQEREMAKEDYDRWTPAEAVLKLFPNRSEVASKRAIAERLSRGDLRSSAKTVHSTIRKEPSRPYRELPSVAWHHWNYEEDDHFWETGDTAVPVEVADGRIVSMGRQLFQVRFDPDGLREMGAVGLPVPEEAISSISPADTSTAADDRRNLPRVPEPALKRWYEFWSATYPAEMQNHETAHAHALASFPKNSVARSRIRDLRGAQKPGPKPAAE